MMQIPGKKPYSAADKTRLTQNVGAFDELLKENLQIYGEVINSQGQTLGVLNSRIYADFKRLHDMVGILGPAIRDPDIFRTALEKFTKTYREIKARYKTHMRMRGWR